MRRLPLVLLPIEVDYGVNLVLIFELLGPPLPSVIPLTTVFDE